MAVAQWRHLASLYPVHHRRPDGTTRRPVHFPWAQAYQVSPPDTVVPRDHLATSIPQVFTCFCADINQPIISFSRVCFVYRALYLFSLFAHSGIFHFAFASFVSAVFAFSLTRSMGREFMEIPYYMTDDVNVRVIEIYFMAVDGAYGHVIYDTRRMEFFIFTFWIFHFLLFFFYIYQN